MYGRNTMNKYYLCDTSAREYTDDVICVTYNVGTKTVYTRDDGYTHVLIRNPDSILLTIIRLKCAVCVKISSSHYCMESVYRAVYGKWGTRIG